MKKEKKDTIDNNDILIIRKTVKSNLLEILQTYVKGQLIDIGCGTKPLKDDLKELVDKHIGIDYEGTSHDKSNIDVFATAYDIPLDDNSFDSAICTEVLEHLEEPEKALRECYRLLKNGGYAIYSVPFIWHLHEEPRDFYRYTNHGLKYLFEKVGFEIIEIRNLYGFIIIFMQLHLYLVKGKFNKGLIKKIGLLKPYTFLTHRIAFFLSRFDNSTQYPYHYIVVARKV